MKDILVFLTANSPRIATLAKSIRQVQEKKKIIFIVESNGNKYIDFFLDVFKQKKVLAFKKSEIEEKGISCDDYDFFIEITARK